MCNIYERVQVSDRNKFRFSKKITKGCHLFDPMEWIIFNYVSECFFLSPRESNPKLYRYQVQTDKTEKIL